MGMTCSNRKNNLNKISSMVEVDIVEDIKIAKVAPESICSIFSQSRFGIQLT